MKQTLWIIVWTVGAYFLGSIVFAFLLGVTATILKRYGADLKDHMTAVKIAVQIVPLLLAALFMFLAMRGRLPGTREGG